MMKILFDIGNSSINWTIQEGDEFLSRNQFKYDSENLHEELEQRIRLTGKEKPSAILVSNVAGNEVISALQDWINKHWQLELWQAHVSVNFGRLQNSYKDTQQMGIDRWLAMLAAWDKYEIDLCVVDCGTALTIDIIEHSGQHLGGYIIPGIEMMQQALIENTEKINVSVDKQVSIEHANNTQAAINHGAYLATVAAINHVIKTLNTDTKCIITGGMAESIQPLLQYPFSYEPDLVLHGLSIAHKTKQ